MTGHALVSPAAEADLDEIWFFIAQHHPENATQFISRLKDRCQWLAEWPQVGRPRSDIYPGLRVWNERKYLICYRIVPPDVQILRIFRGDLDIYRVFDEGLQ